MCGSHRAANEMDNLSQLPRDVQGADLHGVMLHGAALCIGDVELLVSFTPTLVCRDSMLARPPVFIITS